MESAEGLVPGTKMNFPCMQCYEQKRQTYFDGRNSAYCEDGKCPSTHFYLY